jgi:hypothetical protein
VLELASITRPNLGEAETCDADGPFTGCQSEAGQMELPLKGRSIELVTFSRFNVWLRFPDVTTPDQSPPSDYVCGSTVRSD